jgi:hypothetical protein
MNLPNHLKTSLKAIPIDEISIRAGIEKHTANAEVLFTIKANDCTITYAVPADKALPLIADIAVSVVAIQVRNSDPTKN